MKALLEIIFVLIVASCAGCQTYAGKTDQNMTASKVLSDPKKHDGKEYVFEGYLFLESENYSLWDTRSAFLDYSSASSGLPPCLSLKNYGPLLSDRDRYSEHRVRVKGQFHEQLFGPNEIALGACHTAGIVLKPESVEILD